MSLRYTIVCVAGVLGLLGLYVQYVLGSDVGAGLALSAFVMALANAVQYEYERRRRSRTIVMGTRFSMPGGTMPAILETLEGFRRYVTVPAEAPAINWPQYGHEDVYMHFVRQPGDVTEGEKTFAFFKETLDAGEDAADPAEPCPHLGKRELGPGSTGGTQGGEN